MGNSIVKALIKEAVSSKISAIEKAGNVAAENAKIEAMEKGIKDKKAALAIFGKKAIKDVVETRLMAPVVKDLESDIKEFEKSIDKIKKAQDKRAKKAKKNLKEGLPKGYWDKAIEAEDEGEVNESFETLVNKLEKQGK